MGEEMGIGDLHMVVLFLAPAKQGTIHLIQSTGTTSTD